MRRLVVLLPGFDAEPESESPWQQDLSSVRQLAASGQAFRTARPPLAETSEAFYLGMGPTEGQMSDGPLTISGLGADPPDRSTQFHLSLACIEDGRIMSVAVPSPEECRLLLDASKALNTRLLTVVRGNGVDHGLVLEAQGDLATTSLADAEGHEYLKVLPRGDHENLLRRFIDDSVNLLGDLELNQHRVSEGLLPFNLLWPWGNGVRVKVPNLVFRRGEPVVVESNSLRLAGLTRLTGYKHIDCASVGEGVWIRFSDVARRALERDISIVLFTPPTEPEERSWFVREFDKRFLTPILDLMERQPTRMTLVACGAGGGFGVEADNVRGAGSNVAFDERILEDGRGTERDLWQVVEDGVLE